MKVWDPKSITFKLALAIFGTALFVFGILFFINYVKTREMIRANALDNAAHVADAAAARIESSLRAVEEQAQALASIALMEPIQEPRIRRMLKSLVSQPGTPVYGMGLSAPSQKVAPYYYRAAGGVAFADLASPDYDYRKWSWYQEPKALGTPVWSEPYFDRGAGQVMMATYSIPLYSTLRGKREFIGVVSADIALDWLERLVTPLNVFDKGYGYLISRKGTYVTHPINERVLKTTILEVAKAEPTLALVAEKMLAGESGFLPHQSTVTGKRSLIYFMLLKSSGWSLALVMPEDELLSDLRRLNRVSAILVLFGMVALLLFIVLVLEKFTRPLRALSVAADRIGKGEFDMALPTVRSQDEVGHLAQDFEKMRQSLKSYVQDLGRETAAREGIERELKIARSIQRDILPSLPKEWEKIPEFKLAAMAEPAKEVGGDFYDFFMPDPDHLFFLIADVSGKGVAAALFMAMTKTLLRHTAMTTRDPAEVLKRVNTEIVHDNPSCTFVTVFAAVLNIRDGNLVYANAGHNPPIVVSSRGTRYLESAKSPACGVFEEATYQAHTLRLNAGESLLLYTDGVTEAENPNQKMFSEEKLTACLSYEADPAQSIDRVLAAVRVFVSGTPPSDDLTLVALRYQGAGEVLKLRNRVEELPALYRTIERFCSTHGLHEECSGEMSLVLEEVFTNVCKYAGSDLTVEFTLSTKDGFVEWKVVDTGIPFDPVEYPPLSDSELTVGGKGIHLIRRVMDRLEYERAGDRNVLIGRKRMK